MPAGSIDAPEIALKLVRRTPAHEVHLRVCLRPSLEARCGQRQILLAAGLVWMVGSLRRRVVVTGLGMVSPIGNSVEESWRALLDGRSGAAPISRFDAGDLATRFACEVKDLDLGEFVDHKAARRMDRCTHLVLAAARQAELDSGLEIAPHAESVGTAIGTALGGVGSFEECVIQLIRRGPARVSPFSIVQTLPNLAAGWVSIELGTRGPLLTESTACAASSMALGDGLDAIRLGRADVMFCGGTEAPVTATAVASFGAMRALSLRNDDPASCVPSI